MKTPIHFLEDSELLANEIKKKLLIEKPELVDKVDIVLHNTWLSLYQALKEPSLVTQGGVILNRQFPLAPGVKPTDNLVDALSILESKFSLRASQILVFSGNTRGLDYLKNQGITVVSKSDDDYLLKLATWSQQLIKSK